uniref:Uncharacterized protein n=1 Tax=Oryza brachyantha TaxID=4533 RepID=J3KWN6_ORYBR
MRRRWQMWGKPDGSLVWIPASDGPPSEAVPGEAPLVPPDPQPDAAAMEDAPSGDEIIEGPGATDGCSVPSMADLFTQVLDKLVAADERAVAIERAGKGGVFCTGLGRSVAVSDTAIERAKLLVGEVAEETSNKRRQPFGNGSDLERELGERNVSFKGSVHKDILSPMFQTGSGKAVSLNKDLIQKAGAVLEGNVENSVVAVQPVQSMFHTELVMTDPISMSSIDKAMPVLEGQTTAKHGDVADVDDTGLFPLFQTGSGKAVSVSIASIQKAKAVLEQNDESAGNMDDLSRPDQSLIFQNGSRRPVLISEIANSVVKGGDAGNIVFRTGLGRPAAVSETSIQKARAVLDEDAKRRGYGLTGVCTTTYQTETPTSVLMSGGLTMTDRSVTPDGDVSIQGKNYGADGHMPLFQTGFGRSISVSKSSIKRASTLLEPRNITKELEDEANFDGSATPMFKTGSGRSITASENSRKKAHVVLEGDDPVKNVYNDTGEAIEPILHAGIQKFAPQSRSSSHKANALMEEGSSIKEVRGREPPMFRTGSGRSVLITDRSVQRARAVLEEEGNMKRENHKQLNNVDKYIPNFTSPLKTSCIRTVNISSVGVSRAATLLGLEDNTLSTQLLGHVGDKLGTKINVERENSEHRFDVASVRGVSGGCPMNLGPAENQVLMDPHQQSTFSKTTVSDSSEQAIKFSTAGGRSMAISSDALQRAKSLLGESDLEVLPNNFLGHSSASPCKEKLQNSTRLRKGETDLLKTIRGESKTEPAIFSLPAMPDRKHTDSLGRAIPDTTLANGNSVRFHAARGYHPINEIPKLPKPSSRCSFGTENASDTNDKARRFQMPPGPLVDITNYMGTHSVKTDSLPTEKRRIGGRNTISTFKRPRSSRRTISSHY